MLILLFYIYLCVVCYFVVECLYILVYIGVFWIFISLIVVYCLWVIYGLLGIIV